MPDSLMSGPNGLWRWLTILLVSIVFILPALFMSQKSATFDEVSHLPSGYSYLKEREVRYNPQHPPLIKEISSLPLLFLNLQYPENLPESEWTFGRTFLFGQDAQRILFWGRIPMLLLSVLLATLVTLWATKLWGRFGGLLALVLYAFDPTIAAHSQLVTTDVGVACFSLLYLWALRAYLQNSNWKRVLSSGLSLGLALGAKFSAVVLIPVTLLLVALRVFASSAIGAIDTPFVAGDPSGKEQAWRLVGRHLVAFGFMLGVACLVLWALYFFPRDLRFYWNGIESVNRDHGPTPYFYMMGMLKEGGWKSYLLIAWLIKTPIPTLLLLSFAVGEWLTGKPRASRLDEAFLVVPALSYGLFYSFYSDNLGVRYLIPCFPFLFIFAGRLAVGRLFSRRPHKTLMAVILAWLVSEYVAIAPDHLSYFNQVAGGSEKGIEWLSDSNVDWGQGLIQLQRFMQKSGVADYAYFYFGTAEPGYYGIRGRRIENFDFMIRPTKGWVILSAHVIPRARDILDRVFGSGPLNWLRRQQPVAVVGHAYYIYEIR